MKKMWLIARREYLTRVRNKTFLLSTFLLPLVIILFVAGSILLAVQTRTHHRIAVVDANGYFKNYLKGDSTIAFDFSPELDTTNYEKKGCTAVLIIPLLQEDLKTECRLKYKKQLGLTTTEELKEDIRHAISDHLIFEKTGVSQTQLDSVRNRADIAELTSYEDTGGKAKASSQNLSYVVSYASGFLIYLLTFIYGAAVMRGVMEEKTNRIAEVMVSSVRPFELMMGKITGIGAVGLTQFLLWIVLLVGLAVVAQGLIPQDTLKDVQTIQQANTMGSGAGAAKAGQAAWEIYKLNNALATTNWVLIIFCFLFYFIGGYLFYSALFAAVGSAVNEDPQEAQSLMLPITLPVIFSFIIMSVAVQDPGGPLAVWASIIPFSSPIVMMARIPFGVPGTVPWWQLGLSMLLLILGFLGTTWLAGRIYRTGILLYGKKASWKVMWKWAFQRQ
jgi:ABC-2 type transport system permease protein